MHVTTTSFGSLISFLSFILQGITVYMGEHKIELSDLNTAVVDGKSVSLSDKIFTPDADPKIFK